MSNVGCYVAILSGRKVCLLLLKSYPILNTIYLLMVYKSSKMLRNRHWHLYWGECIPLATVMILLPPLEGSITHSHVSLDFSKEPANQTSRNSWGRWYQSWNVCIPKIGIHRRPVDSSLLFHYAASSLTLLWGRIWNVLFRVMDIGRVKDVFKWEFPSGLRVVRRLLLN